MRTALVYLLALAAIIAAVFFAFPDLFSKRAENSSRPEAAQKTVRPVVVARVVKAPFSDVLLALGTVKANESVELTPNRANHVWKIHFEDGQQVAKGDLLVEMNAKEEEAQLREAAAVRDDRRLNYARAKELFDNKLSSQREFDAAKVLLAASEARVLGLEAAIADRRVRAPFAGLLGLRQISVGAYVTPSTLLATLDDLSLVKVDFTIPETWIQRVKAGMQVSARCAAWPEQRFVGKVTTVDTRLDITTRSATVRGHLPNPDLKLRPGMLLQVTINRGERKVLQVPEEALILSGESHFVLRVREQAGGQDLAERLPVSIGRRRVGAVEIVAGLAEDDRVVVEGIVPVDEAIVDSNGVPVHVVRVVNKKL